MIQNQPQTEALAAELAQACKCRSGPDGELTQQCTFHEAHVDAIHDWAARAKTAEKELESQSKAYGLLSVENEQLRASLANVIGCFDAAWIEGLRDVLTASTDERLCDLVNRRMLWAETYARDALQPPAASKGEGA